MTRDFERTYAVLFFQVMEFLENRDFVILMVGIRGNILLKSLSPQLFLPFLTIWMELDGEDGACKFSKLDSLGILLEDQWKVRSQRLRNRNSVPKPKWFLFRSLWTRN